MPEAKMTGVIADAMPAQITAAGRRMPKSTTVASQSSPVVAVTVRLLMLPWYDAYITPPTPAMAADTANTPIFTRNTETPDVFAATSEERVAAIARPQEDCLRLWMISAVTPTRISMNIANVLLCSWLMSNGPIFGRGIGHPDCVLRSQFHWNSTLSPRKANARVARASGSPPRRRAGSATIVLNSTVTATATTMAGRNDQP
jgi:hypothetical protein